VAAYETYLEAPNFAEEGWQARLYLARCHAGRRDWPAARRQFESAVAEAPERAEAVVGLGHTLMAAGDHARAAAWFRMATALWHGLSLALGALGDAAGAAEADAQGRLRGFPG
jgi:Tfp pilus assembly protein PilF